LAAPKSAIPLLCNATDSGGVFARLEQESSKRNATDPPLWARACDICTMLRADMSRLHLPFVLVSFNTLNPGIDRGGTIGAYANFGAFSPGYQHACHSSTAKSAVATGCALALALTARCPEKSLADVIAFLDHPLLALFVVSQDVFQFRRDGLATAELAAHPKLLSFPLGVHWRDNVLWKRYGTMFKTSVSYLLVQFYNRNAKDGETPDVNVRFLNRLLLGNGWRELWDPEHKNDQYDSAGDVSAGDPVAVDHVVGRQDEGSVTGGPSGALRPPRSQLMVSRNGQSLQRVAMAQQLNLTLGDELDVGYNKETERQQ
jgi:hypothetical protein